MNPTFPTPYLELNAVLNALVERVQATLQDNFVAAYLQGSFAIGDFDPYSDVDFLIVTEEEVTEGQVQALQTMHANLYAFESDWAKHLDGSYIARELLNQTEAIGKTPLWYLDNGSRTLVSSVHDNTWVVRWMVRERGITR